MKVLVACEESQTVCKAFRERGHEAYSADIIEPSGGHPEWHILGDVSKIINPVDDGEFVGICFSTMDEVIHVVEKWDLIIAHPPCTYLTVTGNRWFNEEKYGEKAMERKQLREEAADFFMQFVNADCQRIAIENPVGFMGTRYRKCDQTIQPYQFGDPFEKLTCFWLKGLPKLVPTNIVKPPERQKIKGGKSMPEWYSNAPKTDRAKIRSKTFPGIARAMAEQWGTD